MDVRELEKIVERHEASLANAVRVRTHTDGALARADRVMDQVAGRDGAARDAARRERQRLNQGAAKTLKKAGIAALAVGGITIGVGMVTPIGMFGFLAAILAGIGLVALIAFGGAKEIAAPNVPTDLDNDAMVGRFDSYLFRARKMLPKPAQAEVDALSSMLPGLRQTLGRRDTLDPEAQDARRLMSLHLPNLVDRYLHVPAAFRSEVDAEGKSVDARLVEGLAAGRDALSEIAKNLAQRDVDAFSTQGRFLETRYKDDGEIGA